MSALTTAALDKEIIHTKQEKWSIIPEAYPRVSNEGSCSPADITFDNIDVTTEDLQTSEDSGLATGGDKADMGSAGVSTRDGARKRGKSKSRVPSHSGAERKLTRRPTFEPKDPAMLDKDRATLASNEIMNYYQKMPRRGTMNDMTEPTTPRVVLVRRDSFPPTSQPTRPAFIVVKASVDTAPVMRSSILPSFPHSKNMRRPQEVTFSDISTSNCSIGSHYDSGSLASVPEVCFNEGTTSSFNCRLQSRLAHMSRLASRESVYFRSNMDDELEVEKEGFVHDSTVQHVKLITFMMFYLFSCIMFIVKVYVRTPTVIGFYMAAECLSLLYFSFVLYIYDM